MRRPRGRRRVGPPVESPSRKPVSTAGVAYPTPQCASGGEANVDGIASGDQPEGPGDVGSAPEHVAPITGYGAKAPVGFPCWMSMGNSGAAISGRNGRSGRVETRIAAAMRHWNYPRRRSTRPGSLIRGQRDSIPQGHARANERLRLKGISSVSPKDWGRWIARSCAQDGGGE